MSLLSHALCESPGSKKTLNSLEEVVNIFDLCRITCWIALGSHWNIGFRLVRNSVLIRKKREVFDTLINGMNFFFGCLN